MSSSRATLAAPFSSSSGVASSFPRVLSSHRWRLSCGGRRSFLIRPLSRSRMSWGKRRRIGFPAHRSRVSLRFSFLVSPCRLVGSSRAVSSSWCSLVAMGVSCGSARWRLVVVPGRHSFILRRGGVLALILRLSSCSLLVPPSRVASRLLVLPCPAGSGSVACLLVPSCLFFSWGGGRCRSWCRGVLPCFPVSSDLLFSCRRSWRSFSSRRGVSSLVSWSGEALASRLILGGSGWAAVLVLPSRARCLLTFMPSGMGRCRSRHRRSNPLLIVLWLWGMCSVWYLPFSSSSPASCSPLAIALASCRQFDLTNETGDGTRGCLLGYCGVAHHASSMNVYNEYDVCDIYKRYKNTRIREYDGYMG